MRMIQLKLKKELYPLSYISTAQATYTGICQLEVEENDTYWLCNFSACKYEEQRTIMEFENYLIDLMNCRPS